MRVSTRGRYGLRVLLDVALHQGRGPVSLGDIARRQSVSRKYLWQIVHSLKTAGLLSAKRGARGGYVLTRDARDVSLRDVVVALEGMSFLVACTADPANCSQSGACAARNAWMEVESKMNDAMRAVTLARLVQRHAQAEESESGHFVI